MSSISLTLGLRGRLLSGTQVTLQGTLFGNNEPGFTFEPWDISTLFQDRAGTTPVTAAGQSVGLRLDKSKGLVQGPELFTTFTSVGAGWVDNGNGSWTITNAAAASDLNINWITPNKRYKLQYSVSGTVGGSIAYQFNSNPVSLVVGAFNASLTALTNYLIIRAAVGATITISAVSIKEIAGNHEVAVSDAKRGVYGWMPKTGRRNLLTYTEQFNNAVWLKSAATATASVEIDPTGGASAFRAQLEASASAYIYQANITSIPNGQNYTISMWVRSNTGVAQTFRLFGDGTLDNSADLTATSYWQRFTFSAVSSGGTSYGIRANSANGAADILIWGAQLEVGSTATAYQRVVSQYDITEAGVPTCYYVQADGVDDAYVTPTITPNTDKVQVFAGVRKLSDAASGTIIAEFSTTVLNTGSFYLITAANSGYGFGSNGGTLKTALTVSPAAPSTDVLTGLGDISGDLATLRINGTQVVQSTADQGTSNYLAYPAYIYGRGGTLQFNGLDFGHAVRFGPNLDAATIARVESLISRNTPGVTL